MRLGFRILRLLPSSGVEEVKNNLTPIFVEMSISVTKKEASSVFS